MELDSGMKEYIRGLQASIESQEATIDSLKEKNKRLEEKLQSAEDKVEELTKGLEKLREEVNVSKKSVEESKPSALSITEEITKAANEVVNEQFLSTLAYEETTGLYYDYKSGLYYDAARRQFYDGVKGVYLEYNSTTGEYEPITNHAESVESSSSSSSSSDEEDAEEKESDTTEVKENYTKEKKEERELSEGEISSPSPPPPPPPKSKKKKAKKRKKDYENYYYPDDEKSEKKFKRELKIPCVRLVVHATDSKSDSVQVGTLFLVTCKGGTIGREGNHDVLIEDIACSKTHGEIKFLEGEQKYYLIDSGSQNGTFVDGKRLSSAKCESKPKEIGHGTVIQIGSTKMICHVHPGSETCMKCEPGVILSSQPKLTEPSAKDREADRKAALKQIKKKYGLSKQDSDSLAAKNPDYNDRANERRRIVGSDNPYEKTQVASTNESIASTNKGFKMLAKMGWKDGDGLGKEGKGRVEPVKAEERPERQGLGANNFSGNTVPLKSQQKKLDVLKKTQERFEKL